MLIVLFFKYSIYKKSLLWVNIKRVSVYGILITRKYAYESWGKASWYQDPQWPSSPDSIVVFVYVEYIRVCGGFEVANWFNWDDETSKLRN